MNAKQQKVQQLLSKAGLQKLKQEVDNVTPSVYAAFAICLHDRGWLDEEIATLFADTQEEWNKCVYEEIDMMQKCEELTGIDVVSGTEQFDTGESIWK